MLSQSTGSVVQRNWLITTLEDDQKSPVKAPEQPGFAVRRAGRRAVREEQVELETLWGTFQPKAFCDNVKFFNKLCFILIGNYLLPIVSQSLTVWLRVQWTQGNVIRNRFPSYVRMTSLIYTFSAHILQNITEHFTERARSISVPIRPTDEISINPVLKILHTKRMERKNGKTLVTNLNT